MTSWQKKYSEKCVSAAQSLAVVQSGRMADVEVMHMLPLYACEYAKPEHSRSFRHSALFVGAASREAINSGRADYTPCYFSEIPRLFRDGILPSVYNQVGLSFFLNSKLCEKYVGATAQ